MLKEIQAWKGIDGGAVISHALGAAFHAYHGQERVYHGAIVGGLCIFLRALFAQNLGGDYHGIEDLAKRLTKAVKLTTTPALVLANLAGRGPSALGGGMGSARAAAGVFADAWNVGRSNGHRVIVKTEA
jgi:hypothetical protein